ncbi:hypothetical protein [Pseudoalteromonas luteoviolacea]|uniref:Uncharacterized protein n=1 Tax=Pseudoalteromonas luteoviolacea H33 TaxID=1365251 RepID=A0A167AHQ3_9GAMM|nr:hypothetical protein [Pseudoalteromonas luteoviolacea]KZN45395.1 hypothetical protein N476_05095 [Pseudoalteromonas luteoviolacea H33]KZN70741.1 hypothetical protein N477_04945 [Pseudoalteromonas luteoviolacea H33-S]
MDTIIFYLLGSLAFVFCLTIIVLPQLLYKYILPSAPERELSIEANMWPLTLAPEHFSKSGQRIRFIGFKILWCCAASMGVIILGIISFLLVVN